jgi:hypothetical protein
LIENVIIPHLVAYLHLPPGFTFGVLACLRFKTWYQVLILPSHALGALRLGRSDRYAGYPALVLGSVEDGWLIIKQDARSIAQPRSIESREPDSGPPLSQKRQSPSRLVPLRHNRDDDIIIILPAPCSTAKNATRLYKHTPQRSINAYKPPNGSTLYTRATEYSRKLALRRNPPGFYAIEQEQLRHSPEFEGAPRIFLPEPHLRGPQAETRQSTSSIYASPSTVKHLISSLVSLLATECDKSRVRRAGVSGDGKATDSRSRTRERFVSKNIKMLRSRADKIV